MPRESSDYRGHIHTLGPLLCFFKHLIADTMMGDSGMKQTSPNVAY